MGWGKVARLAGIDPNSTVPASVLKASRFLHHSVAIRDFIGAGGERAQLNQFRRHRLMVATCYP